MSLYSKYGSKHGRALIPEIVASWAGREVLFDFASKVSLYIVSLYSKYSSVYIVNIVAH